MCWNINAPSAAYATRDRHSKRWGKSLQNRAAHFLDSALALIPLFTATDMIFGSFVRCGSYCAEPLESGSGSVSLASAMRAEAAEAVNAPHHHTRITNSDVTNWAQSVAYSLSDVCGAWQRLWQPSQTLAPLAPQRVFSNTHLKKKNCSQRSKTVGQHGDTNW